MLIDTKYTLLIYGYNGNYIKTPPITFSNLSATEFLYTIADYQEEIALAEIFVKNTYEITSNGKKQKESHTSLLDRVCGW